MRARSRFHSLIAGSDWALWIGLLGGPVFWLCHLQINYLLVPWACTSGHHLPLHLTALFFLLCAGTIAALAWANWRTTSRAVPVDEVRSARGRFMALLGLLVSVLFALGIFMQGVATFIIGPCAG